MTDQHPRPIKNIPQPAQSRPPGPTADLQRQLDRIEAKLDELLRRRETTP